MTLYYNPLRIGHLRIKVPLDQLSIEFAMPSRARFLLVIKECK